MAEWTHVWTSDTRKVKANSVESIEQKTGGLPNLEPQSERMADFVRAGQRDQAISFEGGRGGYSRQRVALRLAQRLPRSARIHKSRTDTSSRTQTCTTDSPHAWGGFVFMDSLLNRWLVLETDRSHRPLKNPMRESFRDSVNGHKNNRSEVCYAPRMLLK
ncbi:hypothetical protein AVEN_50257-1 [Araneus ventricosus]|uniref:Uncharacterized protein n=1 Tax=Araneus ventricosus TaxID=182803 RepID=A0A4Y2E735_ARAVE|nr:hypothetical protein AVEN_50257-1 [Araneus ventricosus]